MDRRILDRAFDEVLAARLELRLDQCDEPRRGGGERQHTWQNQTQRNETDVADDRSRRRFEQCAREFARIEPFVNNDSAVAPQSRVDLSMADVDRINPPRAARQHDIGEAAGRGANIETVETMRIETERVERGAPV